MSELRINNITDTAGSSGPIIAGVSTVTSTSHMVMPSGPTEMRPNPPSKLPLGGRQEILTSGGRVFSLNYHASNLEDCVSYIYNKIDEIKFDGTIYRTDIGKIYES